MPRFEDQVLHAVHGRHPLIYLHTPEEDRVVECLAPLVPRCFPGGSVTTWSCIRGFEPSADGVDARDPVAALLHMIDHPRHGFYVMKDLSSFMGDPRVVRALREAYFSFCRDYRSAIVIVSPVAVLPESLDKELCYIELDVASGDEVLARLLAIEKRFPGAALPAEVRAHAVLSLRGLTLMEVDHIMHRVFSTGAASGNVLEDILTEKGTIAKKAGFLEFIPLKVDINAVGGLENVKDWAAKRKELFTQEAIKTGLPIPKGILVMGVSGCGKSLLAKAIAGLWQVPLFRLNMSLIFSNLYGSPEAAFHRALRTIEAVAPVVLWIDEMESSLSTPKEAATPQSMVFSAFLTWLQEKPPLVFVAATANRIELLPAELLRKGRFDQVFFCDLPNEEERIQIINIHLAANDADPKDFNAKLLAYCTREWSGAEIEQAVIAARVESHQAGRAMTQNDIMRQTDSMVPLSKTMAEQVKEIRDWAFNRATPATAKR
ncbi:MAG: AAA family ATPase [Elusimicrobia bacterium]|nr:AAA family ATPase [Elusimicrobiota bacterium]